MEDLRTTEVAVLGDGIAGSITALALADRGHHVLLIHKGSPGESTATRMAQGGIVYRGLDDSPDRLVQDIHRAGDGAALPEAARILAEEGPTCVKTWLVERLQVPFDRQGDTFHLTGEAAHSTRRILHVGDQTGQAIQEALRRAVDAHPRIERLSCATAVDLITPTHHSPDPLDRYLPDRVVGVYVDLPEPRRVIRILAQAVVLATGGAGRIFRYSTNPPGATGDGFAMAYRAGARLINMEYVQFHPTAHPLPSGRVLLITEAMRGEGAVLKTPEGEPFMERYHPDGSLAPRDVVARAIHEEMITHRYPHVLLDIASARSADEIRRRFPYIHRVLLEEEGLDITREPIPVVPMAHFFCGGVKTDLWGHTSLPGLYAVGEVACNGLHGANRLASTSLLEGLVFGVRTAQAVDRDLPALPPFPPSRIPPWIMTGQEEPDPALVHQDWQTLQWIMWNYVGVVRTEERLARAIRDLRHLWFEVEHFYRNTLLHPRLVELRNGLQTGLLVARSALRNRTSRGGHYRKDAPV